jgi:hypothetical protein
MQKMIWTPSESAGANSETPNHAFSRLCTAEMCKYLSEPRAPQLHHRPRTSQTNAKCPCPLAVF